MISADMICECAQVLTRERRLDVWAYSGGLAQFVEVLNRYGQLSMVEEVRLEESLVDLLLRRLSIERYWTEHPAIAEQVIERPTFIVGLPRSGSTMLHGLLAQDPRRRTLLNWEVGRTVPPADPGKLTTDARCLKRKAMQQIRLKHRPALAVIHWEFADEPTECNEVLAQDFKMGVLGAMARVPALFDYGCQANVLSTYQYHKRVLQLLQSNSPGIWNLKSPLHSLKVPEILQVFPDARLIWIHRDPLRVLPSYVSMRAAWAEMDGYRNGDSTQFWRQANKELMALQDALLDLPRDVRGNIYNVSYARLCDDPVGEMQALYAWLGDEPYDIAAGVTAWLRENPQHKYGRHSYSLEDFAIEPSVARASFERYRAECSELLGGRSH